jgi:hypothetical protein
MTIPGRRRSDTDRLGDSTPGSDDSPNRPHGWVKKLVIALAVVIVIVVAAETIVSAVLKPPVVRHTSRLDYQSGNFSQWSEQQLHRFEQEAIVTSPARRGYPQTARFTVAPGDQTSGQTGLERAEVAADDARTGDPAEGQDQWFAWSSFFPTGTHVDMPSGWLVFTQWHQTGNTGVPNVSFGLTRSNPVGVWLSAAGQGFRGGQPTWAGEWNLGAIPTNAWVDFVVHITWSTNPKVGHITVKINGTQVADTPAATLYSGMSAYMKQGIYRASSAQTQTIYHTGTRIGPTEDSVTRETCMTSPGNDVPILGYFRRLACRWRS